MLADLLRTYAPRGLVPNGPTKLYGYGTGGNEATPAEEKSYIDKVRHQFYAALPGMAVPLDASNFERYGASTTPTLVLLDGSGVVRYYHPGAVPERNWPRAWKRC